MKNPKFYVLTMETTIPAGRPSQIALVEYSTGKPQIRLSEKVENQEEVVELGVEAINRFKGLWQSFDSFDWVLVNDLQWTLRTLGKWTGLNSLNAPRFIDLQTHLEFINKVMLLSYGNPYAATPQGAETVSWRHHCDTVHGAGSHEQYIDNALTKNQLFFDLYGHHINGFGKVFKKLKDAGL